MKILSQRSFSYPDVLQSEWENVIFRPQKDHKFSIQLDDDQTIECATFELTENGKKERHACISTQAGCKFGCHFCVSGKNGFARHLDWTEIEGQIKMMRTALGIEKYDHIVYMGIGEPLENFGNTERSIRHFTEDTWYQHRISIATVGLPGMLDALAASELPLRMIWVSLHASSNEKRQALIPAARVYPIERLVADAVRFHQITGIQTWLNHMVLRGFNDSKEDAARLSRLLNGTQDDVSVMITIPNGVIEGYVAGGPEDATAFTNLLMSHGIKNRIARFFAAGRRVEAGCGEFVFLPNKKSA
jgi:23S rRNA (adenine2503-C2)-methyltransferase